MAFAPNANVQTLLQQMGQVGDGALTIEEACEMVASNKMTPLVKPVKKDWRHIDSQLRLGDLPLKEPKGTKLTQFCDCVLNQKYDISEEDMAQFLDNIYDTCCAGHFKDLPEPLRLKKEPSVPYTPQIFMVPTDEEKTYHIFKHVNLHKNRVNVDLCEKMCSGQCLMFDYGKYHQIGSMVIQFMMEKLEGFQIRWDVIKPKAEKG